MLSHFLPATRADASDLMGMQRLSILHAVLIVSLSVSKCSLLFCPPCALSICAAGNPLGSWQMLSRALRARSRAMSEHGAPAPCPITREGIRGEGETHTPAEDNAQTRLMERCNLEEMHATLPTSRPVGTCPHNSYGGLTRMTEM